MINSLTIYIQNEKGLEGMAYLLHLFPRFLRASNGLIISELYVDGIGRSSRKKEENSSPC